MEKRNITLSLPKDVLKKAKLIALKEDKSLNAFIKETLEERVAKSTGYREAMTAEIERMETGFHLGTFAKMTFSKDEIHERG